MHHDGVWRPEQPHIVALTGSHSTFFYSDICHSDICQPKEYRLETCQGAQVGWTAWQTAAVRGAQPQHANQSSLQMLPGCKSARGGLWRGPRSVLPGRGRRYPTVRHLDQQVSSRVGVCMGQVKGWRSHGLHIERSTGLYHGHRRSRHHAVGGAALKHLGRHTRWVQGKPQAAPTYWA